MKVKKNVTNWYFSCMNLLAICNSFSIVHSLDLIIMPFCVVIKFKLSKTFIFSSLLATVRVHIFFSVLFCFGFLLMNTTCSTWAIATTEVQHSQMAAVANWTRSFYPLVKERLSQDEQEKKNENKGGEWDKLLGFYS